MCDTLEKGIYKLHKVCIEWIYFWKNLFFLAVKVQLTDDDADTSSTDSSVADSGSTSEKMLDQRLVIWKNTLLDQKSFY